MERHFSDLTLRHRAIGFSGKSGTCRCRAAAAPKRSWALAMMASTTESTLGEAMLERFCQAAQPALAALTRTGVLVVAFAAFKGRARPPSGHQPRPVEKGVAA